jgi:hypothetical protein
MNTIANHSTRNNSIQAVIGAIFACGSMSLTSAYANDDKVLDVIASQKAGVTNPIVVNQNGEKYTETGKAHAPMTVRGSVRCHKSADYDFSYWVYGTVNTAGGEYHPSAGAYVDTANKGVSHASGKNGIMEGTSPHTMQIPMGHLTEANGSSRLDAVQMCNNALEIHVNSGGSRIE